MTLAIAAFNPRWASEITSLTPRKPRRREAPQKIRPKSLRFARSNAHAENLANAIGVDANGNYYGNGNNTTGLANFHIRRVDPEIRPITFDRAIEERVDALMISPHKRETWLFEMPVIPIDLTSSSTERVETPWIYASWTTAISAFSAVRRGSKKPGQ